MAKKSKSTEISDQRKFLANLVLLKPRLFLLLTLWLFCAAVIVWMQLDFSKRNTNKNIEVFSASLNETVNNIINNRFTDTQSQLDSLAKTVAIHDALIMKDDLALQELSAVIKSAFKNADSVQIIPLDETVTAGLNAREEKERSSIDLLMLSLAGSQKTPKPEAILENEHWIFSFVAPVIYEAKVIGAIRLTLTDKLLADILNTKTFTDSAHIRIFELHQANKPIINIGKESNTTKTPFAMPFTNGTLEIQLSPTQVGLLTPRYYIVYGIFIGITLLLSVAVLLTYILDIKTLEKDIFSVQNYAESLSALHKTQQPELLIKTLTPILSAVDAISERTVKSAVIENDKPQKSIQSGPPPTIMAKAVVTESHDFKDKDIFRDYDIRGIADTQLSTDTVVMIGKAIGSEAMLLGVEEIVVGRDGRLSSERIQFDLIKGIKSTGCNVINISQIPTPALYYATHKFSTGSGVMITGSHNSGEYNGLKIVLANQTLHGEKIQKLLHRIEEYDFVTGEGNMTNREIKTDYMDAINSDILITRPIKVVIDAANGVGGEIALSLFTNLDCETIPLYCDVDGNFPNHDPDPSKPENLAALIAAVQQNNADLGIAFDGDADRMIAVTTSGYVLSGDQLLMLFARDIVTRNPASTVVYDSKCSRNVAKVITECGGHAVVSKSGHSNVKTKMQETDALFGGELTGHFFFKERWFGFDDGIYSALRLIEMLTVGDKTLDELVETLPTSFISNEMIIPLMNDKEKADILSKFLDDMLLTNQKIDDTDGVKVEFPKSWGLLRASNTSAALTTRFEADSEDELNRIKDTFRNALLEINPTLSLPF